MNRQELLVATSNVGKVRELHELLKDLPLALSGLADYPDARPVPEIGLTFGENASIKAFEYAKQAKVMALADDSGLEIEALGNRPGLYSARYLGEDTPYAIRNRELLKELAHGSSENRAARFVCSVAIADSEGRVLSVTSGTCSGRIAESPRGTGGFGYDPIFIPDGFDLTFAELSAAVKNEISHRARALKDAREFLRCLTQRSTAG